MAAAAALVLAACHSHGNPAAWQDPHDHDDAVATAGQDTSSTPTAADLSVPAGQAPFPARDREWFLTMPAAEGGYLPKPPSGAQDDYRCFLLDPELTEAAFLTGTRVEPGPGAHHAILYRVPPDQAAVAAAMDAGDEGPGWRCFGGSGLPQREDAVSSLNAAPWLGGWGPGRPETVLPAGFGIEMPPGTQVVLQMHYSELAGSGLDETQLRLRLAPYRPKQVQALQTTLLAAPVELPCATGQEGPLCDRDLAVLNLISRFGEESGARVAGLHLLCGGDPVEPEPGPTQSCDRRITEPMTIRSAASHMHLLGSAMTIQTNPGTARARTVLDVPVYDFDDQGGRWLRRPERLEPGDVVRVTCTHDALLRDRIPALADEQDRYVVWGEGTADEMCLGILSVTG